MTTLMILIFSFSIEKVLQKYGKCFLKMCGNSVCWAAFLVLAATVIDAAFSCVFLVNRKCPRGL